MIDWESRILSHAKVLGVEAEFSREKMCARTRVQVQCEHSSFSTPAYSFCSKVCCCRTGSNMRRTLSEESCRKIGESNRETWLRKDRFWCHGEPRDAEKPDFFYVSRLRGFTKVGRCAHQNYLSRYEEVVYLRDDLLLGETIRLEKAVREKFGHLRPLNPDFGKGWTEVFNVNPHEIISFVEGVL